MPWEKVDGLDIDRVTVPAFAVSFLVLKASLPGTADRRTVSPPAAAAGEDEVVELLGAEAAVELDGALLAELLLLEPPHPATTSTTPAINSPLLYPCSISSSVGLILANNDGPSLRSFPASETSALRSSTRHGPSLLSRRFCLSIIRAR